MKNATGCTLPETCSLPLKIGGWETHVNKNPFVFWFPLGGSSHLVSG